MRIDPKTIELDALERSLIESALAVYAMRQGVRYRRATSKAIRESAEENHARALDLRERIENAD